MFRGRYRFLTMALVAVMSLVLLAACADDDDTVPDLPEPNGAPANGNGNDNGNGAPPTGDFTVVMLDIDFDVETLTIPANEEVTVALINEGVLLHDISIDEIPVDYSVSGDASSNDGWDLHVELGPGQSGSMTLTVQQAGEYTFYCSVPGHREAGMEGTLIVQ